MKIIWEPSSEQRQARPSALPSSHFFFSPFSIPFCRLQLASLISDRHSMQLKSLGNAIFHSLQLATCRTWLQQATCCLLCALSKRTLCGICFCCQLLLMLVALPAASLSVCLSAWATVKCNYGWRRHSLLLQLHFDPTH